MNNKCDYRMPLTDMALGGKGLPRSYFRSPIVLLGIQNLSISTNAMGPIVFGDFSQFEFAIAARARTNLLISQLFLFLRTTSDAFFIISPF